MKPLLSILLALMSFTSLAQIPPRVMDDLLMVATRPSPWTNVTSGLVGYWPMDEGTGTTTADVSGYGNTGYLTNSPAWTNGVIGSALNFSITNMTFVPASPVLGSSNVFTMSVWVNWRTKGGSSSGRILDKSGAGTSGPMLAVNTSLGVQYLTYPVTTNALVAPNLASLSNQWIHIVIVANGASSALYTNGILAGTTNQVVALNDNYPLNIGNRTGLDRGFDGLIDDVRIYSRALDATEVQNLYNWRP